MDFPCKANERCRDIVLVVNGWRAFIIPSIKELYCALKDMGMILTLNTNGTLINEEWAEFFAKNKQEG